MRSLSGLAALVMAALVMMLTGSALSGGCSKDHSRLAKTEATSSGSGGAGGMDAATTTSSAGGSPPSSSSGFVEPAGPTKLTIVNGIVDEPALRLCLVPYPDGPTGELPWPSAEGLPFARGAVADLESLVPEQSDVEVRAVAGSAATIGGKTCAELSESTPNGVSVRSLGVLPASVFEEAKSLLLVTTGCMGGATHTDALEESICGAGYAPESPTAGLVAGFMSRVGPSNVVRMQFVHAVAAMGDAQLQLAPGVDGAAAQTVVPAWTLGAFLPYPPLSQFPLTALGEVEKAALQIEGLAMANVTTFAEAFANSTLDPKQLANDDGLVFVAVGAHPDVPSGAWWNDLTFTVVTADP